MVGSLTRTGKVTVDERGSPMDAKNAIQRQADERQAHYYQILMIDETITPASGTEKRFFIGNSAARAHLEAHRRDYPRWPAR